MDEGAAQNYDPLEERSGGRDFQRQWELAIKRLLYLLPCHMHLFITCLGTPLPSNCHLLLLSLLYRFLGPTQSEHPSIRQTCPETLPASLHQTVLSWASQSIPPSVMLVQIHSEHPSIRQAGPEPLRASLCQSGLSGLGSFSRGLKRLRAD